jgi:hypothetical protein
MESSWALFFAQRCNETMYERCPALKDSSIFNDESRPVVLRASPNGPQTKRHYVYVDNVGALGPHAAYALDTQVELARTFDSVGLLTHDADVIDEAGEVLGCHVDCKRFESGTKASRILGVREAVRQLLQRRRVSGWVVEAALGHATFAGLGNRGTLTCFRTVYRFVTKHYLAPALLWDCVCQELAAFAACSR